MMDAHKKPHHGLPGWLAMCFGLTSLTPELTPKTYCEEHKLAVAVPVKPAKPSKPPTDWRKIPLVTEYELIKKIGKGGFSEIWLSKHKQTKEVVAIKVVQLSFADLEPEEVSTLLAEAKFLRTLDCPYLVGCKATSHTKDWLILVLEYCSGGELLDHLHKVMKYTEAEAAKLFAQIVSAISYLHNLNLIHRDIKPENVMFTSPVEECEAAGRPLRVKVIDLGMAMIYDPKKEVLGCVGTPGFVAPETWNDKPQTLAMDIYSLGVMLFIMLTGRKPHSGADIRRMTYCKKSIHDAPGLKDERFLSLSSAARELLLAMLADDPRDRPSCMEVLRHPFITAVDSNAEAHREMSAEVRRRMRDLHRIRRLHGLGYALRPLQGAGKEALLASLDRRRLKLKGESTAGPSPSPSRESTSVGVGVGVGEASDGGPSFPRNSLCSSCEDPGPGPGSGHDNTGGRGGGGSHNNSHSNKGFGRQSSDGAGRGDKGGGGGSGGKKGGPVDKLALLNVLPELQSCATMPPRRFEGPHAPALSTVPSCDPSMYGTMEEAGLPRNWSAHPILFEALVHREQLLEGLAPGPSLPQLGARAAAAEEVPLPEAPLSTPMPPGPGSGPEAPQPPARRAAEAEAAEAEAALSA
ncbi:hypothetical protein PLESTB_001495300 [Pleodorina starrii]|uniref:Protein kinase domain-containing protein n=1 Tax=Pleodorina starrii TaxID=330485 RepID=A0A9W6BX79_9CHLO|nr:hypothetical protein PLESTM_001449100 [Pleodorina starrii]GLC59512.1 hypothetical protein PLESTB_001495300 [Pleodorina starrii]GLC66285.1 hypothetical protein PLESTF_000407500 [Pleodorina starrii]